jgi:hypothetical protein
MLMLLFETTTTWLPLAVPKLVTAVQLVPLYSSVAVVVTVPGTAPPKANAAV